MGEYADKAYDYRLAGYSCSQAIAMAFSDFIEELDEMELSRLASPFGGGFAKQASLCGCVSGMGIVWGFLFGKDDPRLKSDVYKESSVLSDAFKERYGSIDCCDIWTEYLGDNAKPLPDGYEKLHCSEYIKGAAELLEEYLKDKDIIV